AAGISVHSCNASGSFDWRVFDRLARLFSELRPDLVHSFLFHANLASRFACCLSGITRKRLICEIQTVEIERRWHLLVDRITHRLCAVTVGNSDSVVQHLHRHAGIAMGRLTVIPGGIDVDAFAEAEPIQGESWQAIEREFTLLWVGRMDPIKGLDVLVEAVELVRQKHRVKLLLVGDGPLRASVESQVARRGLDDVVFFLGLRDDVSRLIRSADLFVFPSRTEGMPNAILEAMAGRLPIIATDVAGCHDLVTDGETGRLVEVDNPAALAGAIASAIEKPEAPRKMSATAWHYVDKHHRLTTCHQAYETLYARILGSTTR
ncbi:MAG: glycosyltransferase, partial [Planctomycetes bacterium]|nr:glycosyltransferase [Planctomycetota bacterium]